MTCVLDTVMSVNCLQELCTARGGVCRVVPTERALDNRSLRSVPLLYRETSTLQLREDLNVWSQKGLLFLTRSFRLPMASLHLWSLWFCCLFAAEAQLQRHFSCNQLIPIKYQLNEEEFWRQSPHLPNQGAFSCTTHNSSNKHQQI